MKRRVRRRIIILVVILVAGLGVWWYWRMEPRIPRGSWVLFDLRGGLLPDDPRPSLLPFRSVPLSLPEITRQLRRAGGDERVRGALLELAPGSITPGEIGDLTAALDDFRHHGKRIEVYATSVGLTDWILASHSDAISLNRAGTLDLRTPTWMVPFLGGAFEKLGAKPEVSRVGDEKDLYEQLTASSPSESFARRLDALHSACWKTLIGLADSHRKSSEAIHQVAAVGPLPALKAKSEGWVDHVEDEVEFVARVQQKAGVPVTTSSTYARVGDASGGLDSEPSIAVLHVTGTIVEGGGRSRLPLIGKMQGVGELRDAIREILAADELRGVIVEIDSPGGSAIASEDLWRELDRLRKKLPVVALLGSQATSGGFYAAVACPEIYASPETLTGSIGVVGGKLGLGEALAKIGVQPFIVGDSAESSPSQWEPFTEVQKTALQSELQQTFDLFVERVRAGRGLDGTAVLGVAGGRVYLGEEARTLGLVDGTGGWNQAWQRICKLAEVKSPESATWRDYPRPKSLWERFRERGSAPSPVTTLSKARSWYLGPLIGFN